jgi:hypothetical protein
MSAEHQDVGRQPPPRFVRLSFDGSRLSADISGSDRVPLIPVPASRIDWLSACAGRLWRQQTRCLAALLLVDLPTGRWTIGFPRQRCGTRA